MAVHQMIVETLSYGIQYRLTKKILLPLVLGESCRAGEGGPYPGSRKDRTHGREQAARPCLGCVLPGDIGGNQRRHTVQLWAPLILVVGCRPADAWVRRYDGKNGAEVDASIVATYLMLAAENEGLATLWVGSFDPVLLKSILPGTDGYELVAMINVGYPSEGSAPSAMHGSRVAMEEFVSKI